MERGGKGKTAIPEEEKADEPSILPMTPESKQLAAVIATAVATAMAGRSASPDSSSSMVRYSAGVSLASRTRSIISIVRNLKLHLVTLPGANLASNELLLKLCKAYFALRQITDQAGVSLLIGLEEKTEKNVITKEDALLKLEAGEEIGSYGQFFSSHSQFVGLKKGTNATAYVGKALWRFRATLVRWYSGHLTSRNFT